MRWEDDLLYDPLEGAQQPIPPTQYAPLLPIPGLTDPLGSGDAPPPAPTSRRKLPPNERPPSPDPRAVWNDDWWDGRSDYDGGWLIPEGSPFGPRTGSDPGGPSAASGAGSGFSWPQFNAPTYTPGPGFQAPPAFSYDPFSYESFKAPEFNDIYKDGSFIGRRDEGTQAIEHGAAAKGLTRLPQTLKALAGWNQDFASREYGNIFDRSANTYDRNRGNAFGNWQANRNNAADNYSLNYGVSRDVWDRGEQQNLSAWDRNYKSAVDSFDFNQWKPASMTFTDLYNRWKSELDATTTLASGGGD